MINNWTFVCHCSRGFDSFKEEGFVLAHSPRRLSIMMGRVRKQEPEAAAHVSAVRKRGGRDAVPQLAPCLQSWTPVHGMVLPRVMTGLPTTI